VHLEDPLEICLESLLQVHLDPLQHPGASPHLQVPRQKDQEAHVLWWSPRELSYDDIFLLDQWECKDGDDE